MRLVPLVDVPRVSAVVAPRLGPYVGQSAGEGRWPLCSVSGVWVVVRGGRGSYNLVRTVTYSPPDAPEGYRHDAVAKPRDWYRGGTNAKSWWGVGRPADA